MVAKAKAAGGKPSGKGPGSALNERIKKFGLTVSGTSKDVDINVQTFKKVLEDKSFTVETACKLAKYFGDKPEDWIDLRVKYRLAELKADAKFQNALKAIPKAKAVEPKAKAAPAKKEASAAKKAAPKAGAKRGPKPKAAPSSVTGPAI
jgi:plasmid maintenance system antidote protein VapI